MPPGVGIQARQLDLGSPWDYMTLEHRGQPWGAVLDAGTGDQSLDWLVQQETRCWTALTACPKTLFALKQSFGPKLRRGDRLVLGTWSDPHLLSGEVYDVVIAHYLLGAVERFDPYQEHRLFERLRPLVGRRLYVIGLQPPPPPSNPEEVMVQRLLNYRDAAFLHEGGRHFREYPLEWVARNLLDSGYEVLEKRCFQNALGQEFVQNMIDSSTLRIASFWDTEFAKDYCQHGERLREEAMALLKEGPLRCSYNYLVSARPTGAQQPQREDDQERPS